MTASRIQPGEWNAEIYHRVSNPQAGWGTDLLDTLLFHGDETIVDLGCGTGRVTAELLSRLPNGRVIAVDQSASMLAEAQAFLRPRFGGRVTFVQSDLLAIDAAILGGTVDLAFSTAVFHWIHDHRTLFARIAAVLRPGGRLVAQCGGGPNLQQLLDRSAALIRSEPFDSAFRRWDNPMFFAGAPDSAERLAAAGFTDIQTSLIPAPVVLPDGAVFNEFLTNVIFREHLRQLPEPSLRTAFIERLTEQAASDDPPFQLDYWRLNLFASRPVD